MENRNTNKLQKWFRKIDWLSWSGIIMIIGSYFLNVGDYIDAKSWIYLWMNALGGFLYAVWGYRKEAYAVVLANLIWLTIAVYHMVHKIV